MNEIFTRVKEFYLRNRKLLIGGFAVLLLLQICSRGAQPPVEKHQSKEHAESIQLPVDTLPNGEESLERAFYEGLEKRAEEPQGYNPLFMEFLLMTLLVLLFYVAGRRGWIRRLMPAKVVIRARTQKSNTIGNTLLIIEINNKTKDSVTFEPPVLVFKRFSKERKFKIKGGDGDFVFPLTLMPDTGHRIVIDIDRIRSQVPEIKKYNKIIVIIDADNGKTYKIKPDSLLNIF